MTSDGTNRTAEKRAEVEAAYSEWGGAISRFASRLAGNRDDAEDILVETFAEAFRQWDAFKGAGTRRNWLYGIAANRARMNRRRDRRTFEALDEELESREAISLDSILLRQEIARLPLKQREAFLLVKGEGLTAREAAAILRRPLGTVLYEIHRATKSLLQAIDGQDFSRVALSCEVEP